ncbi:MAG: HD domain-containing protein [Candidatus Nanopelagicaceae bacterium]|nr:HD domain-containing protein [Candidatus Nanopelagicaceae bacterium]
MKTMFEALELATRAHHGQTRNHDEIGLPYILHPIRVAKATWEELGVCYNAESCLGYLEKYAAVALLHDVLEDTSVTEEQMIEIVGLHVTNLVKQLTNPSKGSPELRAVRKAKDREHLRTVENEIKIIKMLDRIDNLQTMRTAPKEFKTLYLEESRLLAETIGNAHPDLKKKLLKTIEDLHK